MYMCTLHLGDLCDNIGLVGVSAKWSYVTALITLQFYMYMYIPKHDCGSELMRFIPTSTYMYMYSVYTCIFMYQPQVLYISLTVVSPRDRLYTEQTQPVPRSGSLLLCGTASLSYPTHLHDNMTRISINRDTCTCTYKYLGIRQKCEYIYMYMYIHEHIENSSLLYDYM